MNTPVKVQKVSKNPFKALSPNERRRLGAMFGVIFFLLIGGTLLLTARHNTTHCLAQQLYQV